MSRALPNKRNPFKSCSWATVLCAVYSAESPDCWLARRYTVLVLTQSAEDCGTPLGEHWFGDHIAYIHLTSILARASILFIIGFCVCSMHFLSICGICVDIGDEPIDRHDSIASSPYDYLYLGLYIYYTVYIILYYILVRVRVMQS